MAAAAAATVPQLIGAILEVTGATSTILAAADAGFSPKGSPLASRSLGRSPARNEADPKDWMAKNRRKIKNGSFGPISKALGKLEEDASRRYMRLQVLDSGENGDTAMATKIDSKLMFGSSIDFG